ncbi:out at first protein isoform X2 [Teleopsis dalmanni]|uniref:out at first protein isoform X2 n=1 Tax=Teleopsis dalmanni TaxID=139649 RepID=UPI0018CF1FC9|nr:out at first protein isoform X2 [Teleopsis dalmanni]
MRLLLSVQLWTMLQICGISRFFSTEARAIAPRTRNNNNLIKFKLGLFVLLNLLIKTNCQLLINVQNQGGEVIQEIITSNVSEDLITLEFQKTDGTLITQVIDFRNEVKILKALVLGEEERGQSQYQVMCFVAKFNKGDFISSDAMSKLRQKNPSNIRTPEEDKGKETFTMTSWVHLNRSTPISRHLYGVCAEAIDATYVRDVDLKAWAELPGSSISSLESAVEKFPDTLFSRCNEFNAQKRSRQNTSQHNKNKTITVKATIQCTLLYLSSQQMQLF